MFGVEGWGSLQHGPELPPAQNAWNMAQQSTGDLRKRCAQRVRAHTLLWTSTSLGPARKGTTRRPLQPGPRMPLRSVGPLARSASQEGSLKVSGCLVELFREHFRVRPWPRGPKICSRVSSAKPCPHSVGASVTLCVGKITPRRPASMSVLHLTSRAAAAKPPGQPSRGATERHCAAPEQNMLRSAVGMQPIFRNSTARPRDFDHLSDFRGGSCDLPMQQCAVLPLAPPGAADLRLYDIRGTLLGPLF